MHRVTRGCDKGEADACNDLGMILENGKEAPKDAVRAVAVFDRACIAGRTRLREIEISGVQLGQRIRAIDKAARHRGRE